MFGVCVRRKDRAEERDWASKPRSSAKEWRALRGRNTTHNGTQERRGHNTELTPPQKKKNQGKRSSSVYSAYSAYSAYSVYGAYLQFLVLLLHEADESVAPPLQLGRVSALEEPVEAELPGLLFSIGIPNRASKQEGRGWEGMLNIKNTTQSDLDDMTSFAVFLGEIQHRIEGKTHKPNR